MSAACLVVAIDGPSGSGKSSVSRRVALTKGWQYLDTGAMYRAVAAWMLAHAIDVNDSVTVAATVERPVLVISTDPADVQVSIDGRDVTAEIRTASVTAAVSAVSAVPEVRAKLVGLQQGAVASALGQGQGIVVEGRDIGTVVLPDADLKIYLTADHTERARRRADEIADGEVAATADAIATRDEADSTRAASPLLQADDAVVIDATDLSFDDVVARVLDLVARRG